MGVLLFSDWIFPEQEKISSKGRWHRGVTDLRQLRLENWKELSRQSGDRKDTFLMRILAQMAEEVPAAAAKEAEEMRKDRPCEIYETILWVIDRRAGSLRRQLGGN